MNSIELGQALDFNGASHAIAACRETIVNAAMEAQRPSTLFRPSLSIDGNMWCALYGENLQDGVAGFGTSPAHAMDDFDKNWHSPLAARATTKGAE